MRRLRSAIVEIHPPNLQASGLEAALADVVSPLAADNVSTTLDVYGRAPFLTTSQGSSIERRAKRFGTSAATRMPRPFPSACPPMESIAQLAVVDDGAGFTAAQREQSLAEGHVGISLLEDVAARMGGRLVVTSEPGAGTSFVLEVPVT